MQLDELKSKIKSKTYPRLLIFTGQEYYVKSFYMNQMSDNWIRVDSLDNIKSGNSLFTNQYYELDGKSLLSANSKDYPALKNKLLTSRNYYVFIFNESQELNKELREAFKEFIVDFGPLNKRFLLKYFASYDLSKDYLNEIFDRNKCNYSKIKLELDKVKHYAEINKVSPDIAFHTLDKMGILYRPVGDYIFDFTGAITSGNLIEINKWLYNIKHTDEDILTIISALYNNFRELYKLVNAEKDKDKTLKDRLGISPGKIWVISKYKNTYSPKEIERNLRCLQWCESGLKTGELTKDIALDFLTINLVA